MVLKTEYKFSLPRGYLDPNGELHRVGTMRLATARDEIEPLRDPRVQDAEDPFLTLIILSRVLTELGSLQAVTVKEIENLFALDLAFLQDLYAVVNFGTPSDVADFLDENQIPEQNKSAGTEVADQIFTEPEEDSSEEYDESARRRGGAVIEEV